MSTRRSSRANKGQHSKRIIEELYDEDELSSHLLEPKRPHIDDDDDDYYQEEGEGNAFDEDLKNGSDEEGEVRCTPCGTTKDNYNEATDKGGTMIQCDSCNTWQHTNCMGFKSARSIPKKYKCDLCSNKKEETQVDPYSLDNLKEKHRISSARAFLAFFKKSIPDSYDFPTGFDKEKLAKKWTLELENVIHESAPKKYNEESRRILFLIKRSNVTKRIIDGELSFEKLVKSSPEEIDLELKEYAEKVRQESIRRSVLTSDENQGQRIRRTHKGEEIVEDVNTQPEEIDASIITRNIDHRRFKDDSPPREIIVDENRKPAYSNYHPNDEEEEEDNDQVNKDRPANEEVKSSESSDIDAVPDLEDDDDLNYIITGTRKVDEVKAKKVKENSQKVALPPILSNNVWSGRITFPEFASFGARGEFYSCTDYLAPTTPTAVKFHNKYIKICKEILSKDAYDIEGRLDRTRADEYLAKIISTRDLFFIQIRWTENKQEYDRLYNYLLNKNKVGVLSGRPPFVKDSYLIAIDFYDPKLPDYLKSFKKDNLKVGLFALYVVKKDYMPTAPSILKKPSQVSSNVNANSRDNSILNSILKQLNSSNQENIHSNYHYQQQSRGNLSSNFDQDAYKPNGNTEVFSQTNSILSSLTPEQRKLLDDVCKQNPQIAENPEAYLQVLQTYLSNNTNKVTANYHIG